MDTTILHLTTEKRNPETTNFDQCSTMEMLRLMNKADSCVVPAVGTELANLARIVDAIAAKLRAGGRLFYVGAGNGGRLALLDARECTPTFNTPPELVQSILAGGTESLFDILEGAEDDEAAGRRAIDDYGVTSADIVFALAASGRTPFVIAAADRAREKGIFTTGMSNNKNAQLSGHVDIAIEVETGPEVVQGSTRLKAGTAQKLVLNMISTCVMAKLGKVYQNMMVDMVPSNHKLTERALGILRSSTGAPEEELQAAYSLSGGRTKESIVLLKTGCTLARAQQLLEENGGVVHLALQAAGIEQEDEKQC